MKAKLSKLLILLAMPLVIFAQDPCEEAGYELSFFSIPSCPGDSTGQITVNSTGCECLFSQCEFEWNVGEGFHTLEDITAGDYIVDVIHPNGCILTGEATVEEVEEFILDVAVMQIPCGSTTGGSIEIMQDVFAGHLDYLWSTGDTTSMISDVPAGTYSVQVTNYLGCVNTREIVIEEANTIQIESSVIAACNNENNGSVNLTISGGSDSFTVLWDNAVISDMEIINLLPGTYAVHVLDDNNCEATTDIIVENEMIDAEIIFDNETLCAGEPVNLEAHGGFLYEWQPTELFEDPYAENVSFTAIEDQLVQLFVINENGCSIILEYLVEVTEMEPLTVQDQNIEVCEGESVYVLIEAHQSGLQFNWSPIFGIENASSNATTITPTISMDYVVTGTNAMGCSASIDISVDIVECVDSGIDEFSNYEFNMYPNPNRGLFELHISNITEPIEFSVFSLLGRRLETFSVELDKTKINLSHLNSGIYYIQELNSIYGRSAKLIIR